MCPIGWKDALVSVVWEDYIKPISIRILLALGLFLVIGICAFIGIALELLVERWIIG